MAVLARTISLAHASYTIHMPELRVRRTLFQITSVLLQHSDLDNPVFQFMDRKRAEGKHFYVYMVAGAAKFLRIYYARVKAHLDALEAQTIEAA